MPRRKRTDPDHPVFEGLSDRERAALSRDYARDRSGDDLLADLAKRLGPAGYAVGWLGSYRSHQIKRRRARWPDEERKPETAAEVRTRKHAARLRKAQNV